MEIIKLSKRLQAIASFIPEGSNVADIGTDHGYIPVWLAQNNICQNIVAADINIGPLDHARKTADEYGVSDKIWFELCNGLDFPNNKTSNAVIIAGMGGELIQTIIEQAPWTKQNTTLVLQPNSKIADLVKWLTENNYIITNAKLVKDAGKFYQILVVSGGNAEHSKKEVDCLITPLYFTLNDPLLHDYITSLLTRYKSAELGMKKGKSDNKELTRIQNLIADLEEKRKEIETWQQ